MLAVVVVDASYVAVGLVDDLKMSMISVVVWDIQLLTSISTFSFSLYGPHGLAPFMDEGINYPDPLISLYFSCPCWYLILARAGFFFSTLFLHKLLKRTLRLFEKW